MILQPGGPATTETNLPQARTVTAGGYGETLTEKYCYARELGLVMR